VSRRDALAQHSLVLREERHCSSRMHARSPSIHFKGGEPRTIRGIVRLRPLPGTRMASFTNSPQLERQDAPKETASPAARCRRASESAADARWPRRV
jgi:hypothetical protein